MIRNTGIQDGEKLARDPRLAAIGYTGSRRGGLALKAAADSVGKPIFLELSSVNPLVMLPGALAQRCAEIAGDLTSSCLMAAGQFCTNPGLVILQDDENSQLFIETLVRQFSVAPIGTLFSASGQSGLAAAVQQLTEAGAVVLCGGQEGGGEGYSYANTVLKVDGSQFLKNTEALQTEAFGGTTMIVVADSIAQIGEIVQQLEGNLTGCIYSAADGVDEDAYNAIVPHLRQRVGRLLNDKMPTGVAVSAAMNHGGPYPATSNPGATAVGMPGAITRFAMLQCFDNVRSHRLPEILQDPNPGNIWRMVDGQWTQADVLLQADVDL